MGTRQARTRGIVMGTSEPTTVCGALARCGLSPSRGGRPSHTTIRVDTRIGLVGQIRRMRAIGGFTGAGQAGAGGMGTGRGVASRRRGAGMGAVRGVLVVLLARDGVLDLVKDVRHDELDRIGMELQLE